MVTAVARSRLGKVATRSDSVAGMTIAAATPITMRARITPRVTSVRAPAIEPAVKISKPMISAPRRLYRSPITPNSSINAAYGTVYPSITHCKSLLESARSIVMAGAATSSDVLAMTTTSRLRHSTPSAAQRFLYGLSISWTGVIASNVMCVPPYGAVQLTREASSTTHRAQCCAA